MYNVQIRQLPGNEDLPLPQQMSVGSSGFDLHAAVSEPVTILPGKWKLIPTGIAIAMPHELEAQVRPRSGLALKHGLTVLNTPGTIDADYRGEIGVILLNLGEESFTVERGDRIAQLVFQQVPKVQFQVVEKLEQTVRGSGGFGHTGK
ncbi:dUTP diphosphatase [Thermoflavimicrobium dichotomicum]|uniref:Deoxyuridine 5'-triphosphate nucleotidohydrolase n=1 Tax=Thermoflavimicrobium dichotomicum TaxID=46223 RepID=A0A1I3PRI5_9BACL|nr:dUTP diphosphatase [Thermoflavimicrobium dichotomicum]SFJ23606.1 dUTP pyrophosphatase [Thermoflavimicrobium dichotomicum]